MSSLKASMSCAGRSKKKHASVEREKELQRRHQLIAEDLYSKSGGPMAAEVSFEAGQTDDGIFRDPKEIEGMHVIGAELTAKKITLHLLEEEEPIIIKFVGEPFHLLFCITSNHVNSLQQIYVFWKLFGSLFNGFELPRNSAIPSYRR